MNTEQETWDALKNPKDKSCYNCKHYYFGGEQNQCLCCVYSFQGIALGDKSKLMWEWNKE